MQQSSRSCYNDNDVFTVLKQIMNQYSQQHLFLSLT